MPHVHQAAMESGRFPILVTLMILSAAFVYLRRWHRLRSVSPWRAVSFLLGLSCIWIVVGSRVAALHHDVLTGHMIQHLLLMTFAAPLIWMGAIPLLTTRGICHSETFVQLCWLGAALTLVVWHIPAVFTVAMRSEAWHLVEQASFLATGLLFWWPVVQPSAGWSMILYLFLATLPCDILSGFLVFSERVAYPIYLSMPRNSTLSVLADQEYAGALMWTCVTIVYLIAGTILSMRLLSSGRGIQSVEVT